MSRKSRKKKLRQKPRPTIVAESRRSSQSYRKRTSGLPKDFQPDYSYVIQDLKRIMLLAGSFVTILIILAIFLG